jgi:hypothetical protein
MINLHKISIIIVLLSQLYGCVGLDFVHSKTFSSGEPEKIEGAEKVTRETLKKTSRIW